MLCSLFSGGSLDANVVFPLQIDFLNSVIVDLQKKNQELKDKLEKMAAAALNGNNPSELDNYDGLVRFTKELLGCLK